MLKHPAPSASRNKVREEGHVVDSGELAWTLFDVQTPSTISLIKDASA